MEPYYEYNFREYDYPFTIWESMDLEFPLHWHEEIELLVVLQGEGMVVIRNTQYTLSTGDAMIIGRKDIHGYRKGDGFRCIMVKFHMNLLDGLRQDASAYQRIMAIMSHSIHIHEGYQESFRGEVAGIMHSLLEADKHQETGYRYMILSHMYRLMTLFLREEDLQLDMHQIRKRYETNPVVESVMHYVEKHYHEQLNLEDISLVAHLSKSYFMRLFKSYTGMTFKQFLTTVRLQRARACLLETTDSVVDIALLCGFNSVKTFNRIFLKHMGCSPTAYRRVISEVDRMLSEKK